MPNAINILLVDDERRNLDALEAILDDQTYRLLRADDADKALRILLENDVAAIVLDIKMPGVSGFELAQLIKGTKKFRQIPIVFLTAYLVEDRDVVADQQLVDLGLVFHDEPVERTLPLLVRSTHRHADTIGHLRAGRFLGQRHDDQRWGRLAGVIARHRPP